MVEMKVTEQTEALFVSSCCFVPSLTKTSQKQQPVPESGERVETALVSQMKGASYQLTDPCRLLLADVSMVTGQLTLADIHQKKSV